MSNASNDQFTACPVQQNAHGMRVMKSKLYAKNAENAAAAIAAARAMS
jgi:hypothetical protein